MSLTTRTEPPQQPPRATSCDVLVVGAGPSGIGAAIRLLQAGVHDVLVIDRAQDFGGTWRANTYPGCACDVPSALYSFTFAPNPGWTRAFAEQPEILGYLRETAHRHDLAGLTRFGTEMTGARWMPDLGRWRVETTNGHVECRFLVSATGPWDDPLTPDVPGLGDFEGEVFHSARWNHDYDLTGRRVAVVGSGASAVQFVPRIAEQVEALHLFQRTAQWVLPKPDFPVPGPARRLLRRSARARRALRRAEYAAMELLGVGFRRPALMRLPQLVGRAHLARTVRDRSLRRRLTPDYTLGCKRLLFSNTYYRALTRPGVRVHATGVARVDGARVVGADGSSAEVDAIILGTGFHITDMPVAGLLRDEDGQSLDQHWRGSPRSYLGTVTHGFPNLFTLLGPNLGTGHSSAFTILESQLELVVGAVTRALDEGWSAIDVRPEVQERYNHLVQEALAGTVYNAGGCSSYYLDANGRNSFSWPWSTGRLQEMVGAFDPDDFAVQTVKVAQR